MDAGLSSGRARARTGAGASRRPGRRAFLALGLAWLLLLLLVGGALGYAFLSYRAPLSEPTVTPAPRFEEAPVPAPAPLSAPDPDAPAQAPAPTSDAPAAGAAGAEAPATEAPATEAPATEAPGADAAGAEPPGAVVPPAGQAAEPPPTEAAVRPAPDQEAALPSPQPGPPAAPLEPAWQRFAMPYRGSETLPRIAVVVTGLGLHDSLTQRAIEQLPPGVTLSFSPYARGVETWLAQARAAGHEVMLDLPMEPESFPNSDPGHFALFVSNSAEQNLARLREILARGSAYVGLASVMGSRFSAEPEALRPVLTALGDRGLIFLDNRESDAGVAAELGRRLGVPTLYNDRTLDGEFVQANAIDSRLAQVERLARTKGAAVAMANVYPTTFRQLEAWAAGLQEKGLALAPLTAVLGRQPPPE